MSSADKKVLFILAALWGGSFIFIRLAAPVFGPILMVEARVVIAGISLLCYARVAQIRLGFRAWWKHYLVLGAINSAIPFLLISASEVRLTASMAVLLNATSPLFGAVVASFVLSDALTARKVIGILTAICGVCALVGWSPIKHDFGSLLSISASLAGALSYGFAGAYIKAKMKNAPAIGMACGSMLGAAVLISPFAAFSHFMAPLNAAAVGSVIALAFICTTLAYILYFRLVISAGPANALSVTFLTPVFGLALGAIFIGEPITPIKIVACLTIIGGTAIMVGKC